MGAKEKSKQGTVHRKSVHWGIEAGKGLKERCHLSKSRSQSRPTIEQLSTHSREVDRGRPGR